MKHPHHDSAISHVAGRSVYIDDIPVNELLLHGKVVYSTVAHARIKSIDISAAQQLNGVHVILLAKDIPGENQMGPVVHDEPCIASETVHCIGQAIALIAAVDDETARAAAQRIQIVYEPLEPILTLEAAIEKNQLLAPARTMQRGDLEQGFANAKFQIKGQLRTGAQ